MNLPENVEGSTHLVDDARYRLHLDAIRDLGHIRLRNLLHHKRRTSKDRPLFLPDEWKMVQAGNEAAHGGRSTFDAFVLTNPHHLQHVIDHKASILAYRKLYGIDPAVVLQHADDQILVRALDQMGHLNNLAYDTDVARNRYRKMQQNFEELKAYRFGTSAASSSNALDFRIIQMEKDYDYLKKEGRPLKEADKWHIEDRTQNRGAEKMTAEPIPPTSMTDLNHRLVSPSATPPSNKYVPPPLRQRRPSIIERTKSIGKSCKHTCARFLGQIAPSTGRQNRSRSRSRSRSRDREQTEVDSDIDKIISSRQESADGSPTASTGSDGQHCLACARQLERIPEMSETTSV